MLHLLKVPDSDWLMEYSLKPVQSEYHLPKVLTTGGILSHLRCWNSTLYARISGGTLG
jgi:hypothetical protein